MTHYNAQAKNFLQDTNTTFKAEFVENNFHFEGEKKKRDIYKITFTRGTRSMVLNFGQCIKDSRYMLYIKELTPGYMMNKADIKLKIPPHHKKRFQDITPTPYDVLACLTKYDVESFQDFCDNFGYNIDSIEANKIYKACKKEFEEVQKLWNDQEIEKLQEIQ